MAASATEHWWLVECENAEAGRVIIATKGAKPGVLIEVRAEGFDGEPLSVGRILASGGTR